MQLQCYGMYGIIPPAVVTPPEPIEIPPRGRVLLVFKEDKHTAGEYKILHKEGYTRKAMIVSWNAQKEQGKRQGKIPLWITAEDLSSLEKVKV